MNNKFIGFNLLKQAVSIERVFERYGLLERFHRSGDNLNGACPIHGGHNRSQFRVSLTRNLWICFGDCQGGGSIVDFVSRMEGTSVREAGLMIQEWFGVDGFKPMVQQTALPDNIVSANPVLGAELGGLDPEHPYPKERGLNGETIATFGLGHCRKGWLAGWIAIPIHNAGGHLVAYAGRWPGTPPGEQPRYRVPRGFHKSWELFNLHRARKEDPREPLILVEGFFGCMKVWQAGFRRVVAAMGCMLSARQADLIKETASAVILLFDDDDAGRKGRLAAKARLAPLDVRIVALGQFGTQPDELTPDQLRSSLLPGTPCAPEPIHIG